MSALTAKFYPINGGRPIESFSASGRPFSALIEMLAEDEEDEARFDSIELWHGDDDYVEAVTKDGEIIGTLDAEPIYPISEYETFDQMELREGREDAEREDAWERRLDARERRAAE
jgi:hypothetical protein